MKIISFSDVNPMSKSQLISIEKKIKNTIKKKDFILGDNVNKFEKKFSFLSNSKYSLGCASGTDALILALNFLISVPMTATRSIKIAPAIAKSRRIPT